MTYHDSQLAGLLKPHLKRVLVLDSARHSARLLNELLRDLGAQEVVIQASNAMADAAVKRLDPQVIFTDLTGPGLDGLEFARALRRSDLPSRQAAVIVITAEATAATILASRQAGAHEFLKKPFTVKDLTRRLDAAILRQRDWIEAINYIGPDRRRFNSGDYVGPRKRLSDHPPTSDKERITQALKILRAAIAAIESDPTQALRSMRAQAVELHGAGMASSDVKLVAAVAVLQRCQMEAAANGRMSRPDIEASAEGLWPYLPAEKASKPTFELN